MSGKLFDVTTVDGFAESLVQGIHAPYKNANKSTLGGAESVSLLLTVSLDAKADWHYGYIQNSRYFNMHISNDGVMEVFSGGSRDAKFRKSRTNSLEDCTRRINKYISDYFAATKIASELFAVAKELTAGTSTTPRYVVSVQKYLVFPGRGYIPNMAWRREYGRPSPQSIKKYVETFNAGLEAGGANSHLGRGSAIWGADIFDQLAGEPVAHWKDRSIISIYKSKPMFEVMAAFPVRTVEKAEGFDQAFKQFMMHAQKVLSDYMAKEFPTLPVAELKPQEGGRYVRITKEEGVSRAAWGFVDKTNGDVLKPAGWSAPAKGARANIFDQSSWRNVGAYGPAYVRNMV